MGDRNEEPYGGGGMARPPSPRIGFGQRRGGGDRSHLRQVESKEPRTGYGRSPVDFEAVEVEVEIALVVAFSPST